MSTPHPSTIDLLAKAWIRVVAPPPKPRGLLEFCRTLRVLAKDPDTGEDRWIQFEPEDHPGQMEVIRDFVSSGFDEQVVLGPVQDGKTYVTVVVIILYCLIELRQSCGLMLPEQDKAEEVWLEKIVPVIKASGYAWILPTEGRGSKSGAGRFIQCTTGATVYLIGAGAKNESAQSSFSVRIMVIDERSKIRSRWVMLAQGRTASYDLAARNLSTSTIGFDEHDPTCAAYDDSTHRRLVLRCPHCAREGHPSGGWQLFEWDMPIPADAPPKTKVVPFSRFLYDPTDDKTARATVRLRCLYSATHLLTDIERKAALRNYRAVAQGQTVAADGTVLGQPPGNLRAGVRWHSLESPIKTMGKLAVMLHKALIQRDQFGDHEQLRQFYRDERVEGYTGDRDQDEVPHQLRRTFLAARSAGSDYGLRRADRLEDGDSVHLADLHPGVEWLTCGVDVNPGGAQAPGRLYFVLIGGNGDACIYDQAWGSIALSAPGHEATEPELHAGLTRLRGLLQSTATDFGKPLAAVGVDVGDRQDELTRWLLRHRDWTPVKDTAAALTAEPQYLLNGNLLDKPANRQDIPGWLHWRWQKNDAGWWLAMIATDEVRHQAQVGFLVAPNKPGAHHLPKGLDAQATLIKHYCATARISNGRDDWRWADRQTDREQCPDYQKRRDYLACRTYAIALDHRHRRAITRQPRGRRRAGVVGKFGA